MIRLLALCILCPIWFAGLQSLELGHFAPIAAAIADDGGDGGGDGGGDDSGGGDDGDDGAGPGGGGPSGWLNFESRRRTVRRAARRRARAPVRREIVATGLTQAGAERLRRAGYRVVNQAESALLGAPIARIKPPRRLDTDIAIRRARALAPEIEFVRNDLYSRTRSSYRSSGNGCGRKCESFQLTAWSPLAESCPVPVHVGVIDTGVDMAHDSLNGGNVTVRTMRGADRRPSSLEHGTAVVSLLAGRPDSPVAGVIPNARILAADAFHKTGSGDTADVFDLVAALDWLTSERVGVINLSLSGPDNPVLKRAIERTLERNIVVVAAAGRPDDGPNGGFPGRYEGVVAVSAVDVRLRPSRLAARGTHITFAAPGVGINVAAPGNKTRLVDGTSFAAPFVAAAYAMRIDGDARIDRIEQDLVASARDLGAPGRDPVYGWGLIQYAAKPQCRL